MPTPPSVESIGEPMQGVTHENVDNLFTIRQPTSMVFMTCSEVEAILKKVKEKSSASSTSFNLKPPFQLKRMLSLILQSIKGPNFNSLMAIRAMQDSTLYTSLILWELMHVMLIFA